MKILFLRRFLARSSLYSTRERNKKKFFDNLKHKESNRGISPRINSSRGVFSPPGLGMQ